MKRIHTTSKILPVLVLSCIAQLAFSLPAFAQTGQSGTMADVPGMQNMPGMEMPPKPAKKKPVSKAKKKSPSKAMSKNRPASEKETIPASGKMDGIPGMDHSKTPGMTEMPGMGQNGATPSTASPEMQKGGSMKMDGTAEAMPGMSHGNMSSGGANSPTPSSRSTSDINSRDHAAMPATAARANKTDAPEAMQEMQMGAMAGMNMGAMQGGSPPPDARDPNAYADGAKPTSMHGMEMADDALFGRLLVNELEYTDGRRDHGQLLDADAWYGGDYNKAWFKVEAERQNGRATEVRTEVMWDRVFATHWSTQLGARRDTGSGPARTWLAAGVRGLAPYWFDTEATAYLGRGGAIAARFEARYEVLFTQRLILQPKLEANLYGKDDVLRGIGSGLSDLSLGIRLRYEVRRQFAPYIGAAWKRKFGKSADFARREGSDVKATELVAGLRLWY